MHDSIISITFLIYIGVMLAIGIYAWRKTKDLSDYILGGRKVGTLTSAISAGASDMSGWLLLGLPGAAYLSGISAIWIGVGLLVGSYLNWLILAKRLRIYTFKANNSLTIPEFLANRFKDKSNMLRVVSAILILTFFLFYTASGLVAGGKLFSTVFGLPYEWAVVAGTLAVISYTLFGGFLAVVWTDLIQGLLMAAALVIIPLYAIGELGGFGATNAKLLELNPEFWNLFWDAATLQNLTTIGILSSLAWGLGYFGQPHILARFAAIKDAKNIARSRLIAVSWTGICLLAAVSLGLVGKVFFADTSIDAETIFMLLVDALFHPVVAGILLAAILAAIMSTADSQLLVSSSALTEDFYRALVKPDASQKHLVFVSKISVVIIALIATYLAMNPKSNVLNLVAYAWAGFGAAFGPVLLLSLFWKRSTGLGALAGMIIGMLTVVVWKQLGSETWFLFDLYELLPGFIFAALGMVVFSLLDKMPEQEILQEFEAVKKEAASNK